MIILKDLHLQQIMEVWSPKYNSDSLTREYGEQVALLHLGKVTHGSSPYVIVQFTKAKHLIGLRFAIKRSEALKCAVGTNGKSQMLEVPLSKLEPYLTAAEDKKQTHDTIYKLGWWNRKETI